ncbi:MAG: hypothetical protein NZV14_16125 [Bryobacteraceae bacterium]|nr:hypothetical protein [Bryobacteraceae bacterium]MDW8379689.1 hypothetical protein [Bryobacterales bacterium]
MSFEIEIALAAAPQTGGSRALNFCISPELPVIFFGLVKNILRFYNTGEAWMSTELVFVETETF